jgi:hypothetical protein
MQAINMIGELEKGGQPNWSYDLQASPLFWIPKAQELNRMVELGFSAWCGDIKKLREMVSGELPANTSIPPPTLGISFFLAALAIENLLKAILVRQRPESIRDGKFRGERISSHDLSKIANEASISLNLDEQDFCELASEAIVSFGRYHLGKNMGESPTRVKVKETAFVVYKKLYQKLISDIYTTPFPPGT